MRVKGKRDFLQSDLNFYLRLVEIQGVHREHPFLSENIGMCTSVNKFTLESLQARYDKKFMADAVGMMVSARDYVLELKKEQEEANRSKEGIEDGIGVEGGFEEETVLKEDTGDGFEEDAGTISDTVTNNASSFMSMVRNLNSNAGTGSIESTNGVPHGVFLEDVESDDSEDTEDSYENDGSEDVYDVEESQYPETAHGVFLEDVVVGVEDDTDEDTEEDSYEESNGVFLDDTEDDMYEESDDIVQEDTGSFESVPHGVFLEDVQIEVSEEDEEEYTEEYSEEYSEDDEEDEYSEEYSEEYDEFEENEYTEEYDEPIDDETVEEYEEEYTEEYDESIEDEAEEEYTEEHDEPVDDEAEEEYIEEYEEPVESEDGEFEEFTDEAEDSWIDDGEDSAEEGFIDDEDSGIVGSEPEEVIEPVKEEPKIEVPREIRQFIKKNPGCTIEFAAKYYPMKDIQKEIKTGKIYKRKGMLFI